MQITSKISLILLSLLFCNLSISQENTIQESIYSGSSVGEVFQKKSEGIFQTLKTTTEIEKLVEKTGYTFIPFNHSELKIGDDVFFLAFAARPIEYNPTAKYRCGRAEERNHLMRERNGVVIIALHDVYESCFKKFSIAKSTNTYILQSDTEPETNLFLQWKNGKFIKARRIQP